MTGEVVIRRAAVADAEAGARMHVQCWREAYAGIVPARALADFTADEAAWVQRWRTQIEAGVPRFLALRDGEVVGFAAAGPDREGVSVIPVLYAIYVRRSEYGTGLAQRLLDQSIGDGPATLWVLADNPRAVAFYTRNGFVPTGETRVELEARVIAMARG